MHVKFPTSVRTPEAGRFQCVNKLALPARIKPVHVHLAKHRVCPNSSVQEEGGKDGAQSGLIYFPLY